MIDFECPAAGHMDAKRAKRLGGDEIQHITRRHHALFLQIRRTPLFYPVRAVREMADDTRNDDWVRPPARVAERPSVQKAGRVAKPSRPVLRTRPGHPADFP